MTMIKRLINRLINVTLRHLLPNYSKRMIFISSVAASINAIPQSVDTEAHPEIKDISEKINNLMNLSKSSSDIIPPMVMHSYIWHDRQTMNIEFPEGGKVYHSLQDLCGQRLTPAQARIVANTIIAQAPEWMHYSSKRQTRKDLIMVLSHLKDLSQPRGALAA